MAITAKKVDDLQNQIILYKLSISIFVFCLSFLFGYLPLKM